MEAMASEAEEVLIEDSDDSLLDIKEINDIEFDIPPVIPPSLESILWENESTEGSDNASLHSLQSLTLRFRSILHHCILQGISSQVSSAAEKVKAGLPTVITNGVKLVAIGTSHGYVLAFDSEQKLCWCCHDQITIDQGAISALAFNLDSTRLLVGYERGYISMVDATTGDVIRRLPDAHAPQSAVLQLRFTTLNNVALCGDSSGCVFSLNFSRRLGVRKWDSKCLFSGARGEVCVFEPFMLEMLGQNVIVAMATLSKIIVISIKPKLRVLFSQQLPKQPNSLPLLSWQLVAVGKSLQPVLAWGRGDELNYTRVVFSSLTNNKVRLSPLRSVKLPYSLLGLHWLGQRHLALLDTSENLRLVEVRTQRELEVLEIASAGLVYSSAHFKALAVGGGVSEAFALAGERACYNSLSGRGDQLLVLGTKAVHLIKLRSWHERLVYLSEQGRWAEALNLAAEDGQHRDKSTSALLEKFLTNINQNSVDKESLTAAINCCIKLNKIELLCNDLWEAISTDQFNKDCFFNLLTDHINSGVLTTLTPSITQVLVSHLSARNSPQLESTLVALDVGCLDLHQVLNIAKEKRLYEAWIHITSKTIGDYTSPITEFLKELTPENHKLGNTMLVYVSSCLAGLGYPRGNIPEKDVHRAKHDVLRCLEATHSINAPDDEPNYPYLRALLKYNTRECLNVIGLAFTEEEFSGEIGLLQRKRLVNILLQIVKPPEFQDSQIINLACFISRLVTSNNLKLEDNVFDEVVNFITSISSCNLTVRDHSDREQAWLDLLLHGNVPIKDLQDDLLEKALNSQCFRVAKMIYEQQKEYSSILACYLNDPFRKEEVFGYIVGYLNSSERCIQEQFIVNFNKLLELDCVKTTEIVVEHFVHLIDELYAMVQDDEEICYQFLKELVASDVKISADVAEHYLSLLCKKGDKDLVVNFVQLSLCRTEVALKITKEHQVHAATAVLLEQTGEYQEALSLLLENGLTDMAVEVCIRCAEHLDSNGAQQLWLLLLRHPKSGECMSLRQLLHAAAPHVPPSQLLELVSDASLGDIKKILENMLADCSHDKQMMSTTLKLLGKDLHHGLAKLLCMSGKGVLISKTVCSLCQLPLLDNQIKGEENMAAVWGCGHCFHYVCLPNKDKENACPQCRKSAVVLPMLDQRKHKRKVEIKQTRPDLEGHF